MFQPCQELAPRARPIYLPIFVIVQLLNCVSLIFSLFSDTSILDPIWDISQMATSIICCCAPSFPAVFAGVQLLQPFRSLLSSLRSSRGTATASSGTGHSGNRTWVPMDSSQRNLARTQVSTGHYNEGRSSDGNGSYTGPMRDGFHPSGDRHYPMKVMEIRHDVEFV